jgi:hypothetical protein
MRQTPRFLNIRYIEFDFWKSLAKIANCYIIEQNSIMEHAIFHKTVLKWNTFYNRIFNKIKFMS